MHSLTKNFIKKAFMSKFSEFIKKIWSENQVKSLVTTRNVFCSAYDQLKMRIFLQRSSDMQKCKWVFNYINKIFFCVFNLLNLLLLGTFDNREI